MAAASGRRRGAYNLRQGVARHSYSALSSKGYNSDTPLHSKQRHARSSDLLSDGMSPDPKQGEKRRKRKCIVVTSPVKDYFIQKRQSQSIVRGETSESETDAPTRSHIKTRLRSAAQAAHSWVCCRCKVYGTARHGLSAIAQDNVLHKGSYRLRNRGHKPLGVKAVSLSSSEQADDDDESDDGDASEQNDDDRKQSCDDQQSHQKKLNTAENGADKDDADLSKSAKRYERRARATVQRFSPGPRHKRKRAHVSGSKNRKRLYFSRQQPRDSGTSEPETSGEPTTRTRLSLAELGRWPGAGLVGLGHRNTTGIPGDNTSRLLADIQPLEPDPSITFDAVGGLTHYIKALKEMIHLPFLYPEVFEQFHITPPRGVLFYGPPGTGKTLVARALASSASTSSKRVTFFMRKGADVLSEWVGEAEKSLRLLFEEARRQQPSIIFFDEIDGLAPVRTSRQDQVHNSIVSTLLALMDGLDSRGKVVVIGATNRIDALDGALRRPGRFDREFAFPLPSAEGREEILKIHTASWQQKPPSKFMHQLAALCVGYCGADLKALCTEAAIRALRRVYPQIYDSDDRLLIDVNTIVVQECDFEAAMSAITPAAHRSALVHARPLSLPVAACLASQFNSALQQVIEVFPPAAACLGASQASVDPVSQAGQGIAFSLPCTKHPRLLLCGPADAGQDHMGPALLHILEQFPVHSIGLPALLADAAAKGPEEALVRIIIEAQRSAPAVLYLPHVHLWWEVASDSLATTLLMLLAELPPTLPVLLLATSGVPHAELHPDARSLFGRHVYEMRPPSLSDRLAYFAKASDMAMESLRTNGALNEIPTKEQPVLPKAPARAMLLSNFRQTAEIETRAVRQLRMFLREVCTRVLADRKWKAFASLATKEGADGHPVANPMDLSTLLRQVDTGTYMSQELFLSDVHLIVETAKEVHGEDSPEGIRMISKAYALEDTVHGMMVVLDPQLVTLCEDIAARGGPVEPPPASRSAGNNRVRFSERLLGTPLQQQAVQENAAPMTRAMLRCTASAPAAATLARGGVTQPDGATAAQAAVSEDACSTQETDDEQHARGFEFNELEYMRSVANEVPETPQAETPANRPTTTPLHAQPTITSPPKVPVEFQQRLLAWSQLLAAQTGKMLCGELERVFAQIARLLQKLRGEGRDAHAVLAAIEAFARDIRNFRTDRT
eukprot:jgi/Chlat1/3458/Chrsp23S03771